MQIVILHFRAYKTAAELRRTNDERRFFSSNRKSAVKYFIPIYIDVILY